MTKEFILTVSIEEPVIDKNGKANIHRITYALKKEIYCKSSADFLDKVDELSHTLAKYMLQKNAKRFLSKFGVRNDA